MKLKAEHAPWLSPTSANVECLLQYLAASSDEYFRKEPIHLLPSILTMWFYQHEIRGCDLGIYLGQVEVSDAPSLSSSSPPFFSELRKLPQAYSESQWTWQLRSVDTTKKLYLRISIKQQNNVLRGVCRHTIIWSLNPELWGLWILLPRTIKRTKDIVKFAVGLIWKSDVGVYMRTGCSHYVNRDLVNSVNGAYV